jgi:hypothetical protein
MACRLANSRLDNLQVINSTKMHQEPASQEGKNLVRETVKIQENKITTA